MIMVPVSVGELIDKITILEIKLDVIENPIKRVHMFKERSLLLLEYYKLKTEETQSAERKLKRINKEIWRIMDGVDSKHRFWLDQLFLLNKERAAIKREINELTNSEIIEEKQYG